jgi:adenylate cyclase
LSPASFGAAAFGKYAEAFAKLEAGDAAAMPAFAALVGLHADAIGWLSSEAPARRR